MFLMGFIKLKYEPCEMRVAEEMRSGAEKTETQMDGPPDKTDEQTISD